MREIHYHLSRVRHDCMKHETYAEHGLHAEVEKRLRQRVRDLQRHLGVLVALHLAVRLRMRSSGESNKTESGINIPSSAHVFTHARAVSNGRQSHNFVSCTQMCE